MIPEMHDFQTLLAEVGIEFTPAAGFHALSGAPLKRIVTPHGHRS